MVRFCYTPGMAEPKTTVGGKTRIKRGEAAIAGCDPFQDLLDLCVEEKAYNPGSPLHIKLLDMLMPYVKPKLRQIEHTGLEDVTIKVIIGG